MLFNYKSVSYKREYYKRVSYKKDYYKGEYNKRVYYKTVCNYNRLFKLQQSTFIFIMGVMLSLIAAGMLMCTQEAQQDTSKNLPIVKQAFEFPDNALVLADIKSEADLEKWSLIIPEDHPEAKGELRFDSTTQINSSNPSVQTKTEYAELKYDFTEGGYYIQFGVSVPDTWLNEQSPDLKLESLAVGFELKAQPGQRIYFWCSDESETIYWKRLRIHHTGWQHIQAQLAEWEGCLNGPDDRPFEGNPQQVGMLLQHSYPRVGSIYFNSFYMMVSDKHEELEMETTYTLNPLQENHAWHLRNAEAFESIPSIHWASPVLDYDFNEAPDGISLSGTFNLLGKPIALKLYVEGDALPDVKISIGSHFQTFNKTISLSDAQEQSESSCIEIPLGEMRSWEYSGGDNDGKVHFPLRLNQLTFLPNPNQNKRGSLTLHKMELVTNVTPETAVDLVANHTINENRVQYECQMHNLLQEPLHAVLTWEIHDYQGNFLVDGEEEVLIPAGMKKSVTVEHALNPKENFQECTFTLHRNICTQIEPFVLEPLNAIKSNPVSTCVIRPITDAMTPELQPHSKIGAGLYLYRYKKTEEGYQQMHKALALARDAGVKWTREEFNWGRIEPKKGELNWEHYDNIVDSALNHGIQLYGLISYWSPWTEPYTKQGIQDYAAYCKTLVSHYKDRIKHWEVWNEPNIFFWKGPKSMYSDLLKAAYTAIKEADPEAHVLGCSTASIDQEFIKDVMKAKAPFDILTVHPYRARLIDADFYQELKDTKELVASYTNAEYPVWITEMGWASNLYNGLPERIQAQHLARSYLVALASDAVGSISWYDFREDCENPYYNECCFGIVDTTLAHLKPAYRALASIGRFMNSSKPDRLIRVDAPDNVFAFKVEGQESGLVIWSYQKSQLLSLVTRGAKPVAVNLMQEEIDLIPKEKLVKSMDSESNTYIFPAAMNSPIFLTGASLDDCTISSFLTIEHPQAAVSNELLHIGYTLSEEVQTTPISTRFHAPKNWMIETSHQPNLEAFVPLNEIETTRTYFYELWFDAIKFSLPFELTIQPSIIYY